MLRCQMQMHHPLRAEMAVLRSADRSIQYQAENPIEITNNNIIRLKLDTSVLNVDSNGRLTLEIPSQGDINRILEHLGNYLPSHTRTDKPVPLVTDGAGKAKWATDTIGSDVKPVFLNCGKFTASNGNKGSSIKPIYFENGEIKETNANIGRANTPICMFNGNLIECTSINEAAYKSVANAITASLDELVPSYYIKLALDAINTSLSGVIANNALSNLNFTANGSFYFFVGDLVFQYIKTTPKLYQGTDLDTVSLLVEMADKQYLAYVTPSFAHDQSTVSSYVRCTASSTGSNNNVVYSTEQYSTTQIKVVTSSPSNGHAGHLNIFVAGKRKI